jgi:hypothetical protein
MAEERVFRFHARTACEWPLGLVADVKAHSIEEAVSRLRAALRQLDGHDLPTGGAPGVLSLQLTTDEDNLNALHLDE